MPKPLDRAETAARAAPGRWRGLALRALRACLVALCLAASPAPGAAAPQPPAPAVTLPPPPARLPAGYDIESHGEVRWTYPARAAHLAQTLIRATPEIWAALGHDLGQPLPPALDIRIAVNPDDMAKLAGRALPDYASGVAFPAEGLVLLSLTAPETWLRPDMRQLLTHELAHVALHRAVGGQPVPRWFTEGVAIHEAGERSIARIRTLWTGAVQRRLIGVDRLSAAFPRQHGQVDLAYAQSADLVRYMLDGSDERARFRRLIGLLREGRGFDTAIQGAYKVSLGYLEREWRGQIQRRYGRWPSVLIGLTGIWGLAALALIFGYFRARRHHHATLQQWALQEADQDAALAAPAVAQAVPPPPPRLQAQPVSAVDRLLERPPLGREADPEIPTVQHEGQQHTLH